MMKFDIAEHLPEDFSPNSKVWIYQANKLFMMQEAFALEDLFKEFIDTWQSHGAPVKGYANLFFGRFIVLMADESQVHVGGCSTDSSQRFIKEIEKQLHVNLFDRLTLCFYIKNKVEMIPMAQLEYGINSGLITQDTLYFNNTVQTKKEMIERWIVPAGETWLARYFVKA